jgi:Methyltransferase domain
VSLKARGKAALARGFATLQRVGVDVLPRHFYSSIPDIRRLRKSTRWRAPRSFVDVAGAEIGEQLDFLRRIVPSEMTRALSERTVFEDACEENGATGFGPVEANCLYAFVHSLRPKRIVQVGAGVSTAVTLRAAADAGYRPEVTAIDPYPTPFLRRADVKLLDTDAQDVALEEFTALSEGDLLFVDSTHAVRPDSEVNRLVLEVLPRLSGVWVHFHDIYFPYDYQRDVLDPPLFFWSETSLVHAFLVGHRRYRIAAALSMLHYVAPDALQALIPGYNPAPNDDGLDTNRNRPPELHFPSSLYLAS